MARILQMDDIIVFALVGRVAALHQPHRAGEEQAEHHEMPQ